MKGSIEIIEPLLFSASIADEIVACVCEAIEDHGECSIALAGGSTPGSVYRLLAKPPRVDQIEWSKLKLFWGDERWVPHSDNQSNFKMVQETLLSQLHDAQPKVYPVNTDLKDPETAAIAYEKDLKSALGESPVFDLVLLGVGEDGHTASIFPGSPLLNCHTEALCAAVPHPTESKPRISLSPQALLSARRVLFMVKGEAKAEIIAQVLEGEADPLTYPSRLFVNHKEGVSFFLDSGAALKLSKR